MAHLLAERPVTTDAGIGQGKHATTILADQGDIVTVITDLPYTARNRHPTFSPTKGNRAMHRSTLYIPTQPYSEYLTTSRQFQSGVGRPDKSHRYGSQHVSQIVLGRESSDWHTGYSCTFIQKDTQPPAILHRPSFENRLNMNEGSGLKRSMTAPGEASVGRYWTQYNRIHNKVGVMLGPGVSREPKVRQQFNPLTGHNEGDAWRADNRRVSGNRILYNTHRKQPNGFVLG